MKGMPSERHIRHEAELEGESYEKERAEYEAGAAKRKKRKHGGATEGEKSCMRLDRPGRKSGGKTPNFHPGGEKGKLHRELGIPESEKIGKSRLAEAAHSKNPEIRRDAIRAETMGKWHHGGHKD
jgi:hypothetical protein